MGRITSTKTKKEAREIIARNYAITNPILQKESKYVCGLLIVLDSKKETQ